MVVYNVTISLDINVAEDWLAWMRDVHVPEVMSTGHFRDSKICRVHGEEEGGVTYAIMYTAISQEDLDAYEAKHGSRLQTEHTERFQGKLASFMTLLSVVHKFKQ